MARKKKKDQGDVAVQEEGNGEDSAGTNGNGGNNGGGMDFQSLLELNTDGLLIISPETRAILYANKSVEKLLRKKMAKILAEPFPEELVEGPMRTVDLTRKVQTVSWNGQDACFMVLSSLASSQSAFHVEWRIEAAEERARESEEEVERLRQELAARPAAAAAPDRSDEIALLQEEIATLEEALAEARKDAAAAPPPGAEDDLREARAQLDRANDLNLELKDQVDQMEERLRQVEEHLLQAEERASQAEVRADEAEALMEEAEAQTHETEKHVEDLTDSIRHVEEQLETLREELEAARRSQREEADRAARLETEISTLRLSVEASEGDERELTQRCRELDSQVHRLELERDGLQGVVTKMESEQAELLTRLQEQEAAAEALPQARAEAAALQTQAATLHLDLDKALRQIEEMTSGLTAREQQFAQQIEAHGDEFSRLLVAKDEQLAQLRSQVATAGEKDERLAELKAQLTSLEEQNELLQLEKEDELASLREQLAEQQKAVAAGEEELSRVKDELELAGAEKEDLLDQLQQGGAEREQRVAAGEAELATLQQAQATLQAELEQLTERLAGAELDRDEHAAVRSDLETSLAETTGRLEELTALQEMLERERQQSANLQAAVEDLRAQLESSSELLPLLDTQRAEIDLLTEQQTALNLELDDLSGHNQELQNLLNERDSQMLELRQKLEESTARAEQISTLNADKQRLEMAVAEKADAIEELRRRVSEGVEQSELHDELMQVQTRANQLEEQLTRVQRQGTTDAEQVQVMMLRLEAILDAKNKLAEELSLKTAHLQQLESEHDRDYAELETRLKDAEQRATEAEELLEESEDRASQAEKQLRETSGSGSAELQALLDRNQELSAQLSEAEEALLAAHDNAELESLRQRHTELEARVAEDEVLRAQAQEAIVQLREQLEAAQSGGAETSELQAQVAELQTQLAEAQSRAAAPAVEDGRLAEAQALVAQLQAQVAQAGPDEDSARRLAEAEQRYSELETQARSAIEQLQEQLAQAQAGGTAAADPETEQLAFQDGLTGLPNANLIRRYLDYTLKQVERYERSSALLHIDLDKFQLINDTFGKAEGDKVILQVAERLQGCVRTSDVLGRKGGDQFLVLLSEVSGDAESPDSAAVVVQRIHAALEAPLEAAGQQIQVSTCVGVSQFPGDSPDSQAMLDHAQLAVQRAKELGRSNTQFYTPELQQRFETRSQQQAEIERAVKAREFGLVYQPIVALATGKLAGVESLLRWNHPSYGTIAPDHFLEVAEDSGQLVALGRWVILQACEQLCQWSRQGLDIFVTVNLSARQFLQADLAECVQRSLEVTGAPPHNLVLELPETVQTLDGERVEKVVAQLKAVGARVALDRFGSGFSSLERLHPDLATFLKVDRKFVSSIGSNPSSLSVTTAAIVLARSLRLRPIAVGVESESQLRLCQQMECDFVQGNLIYTPVEANLVADLARSPRILR